jgi:hypothetical protein
MQLSRIDVTSSLKLSVSTIVRPIIFSCKTGVLPEPDRNSDIRLELFASLYQPKFLHYSKSLGSILEVDFAHALHACAVPLFPQKSFIDESALDRLSIFLRHALSANDIVP